MTSQFGIAIVAGLVLFLVTSFVSLAVWAINAKVNSSQLRVQNEMLQLELKIANEYIKPAMEELHRLVEDLKDQLNLRDELREGFAGVHGAFTSSRDQSLVRDRPRNS